MSFFILELFLLGLLSYTCGLCNDEKKKNGINLRYLVSMTKGNGVCAQTNNCNNINNKRLTRLQH